MNTASVSEPVSNSSWVTPTTSATTQSWPPSTGYEQYYNYYQTVPPPTTTSTTSTTNYQQDYSQAWDEYYKAYYGQSYATPTTTQYPTNYSYDQYGYANFSAPPPNYFDPPPQSSNYDYSQPTQSASSSYPGYNTTTVSIPTTNWSEPPPSFSQPPTYNTAQSYEQPQSFSQPPPISSIYDGSLNQNSSLQQIQQSTGDHQMNSFGDPLSNKQKFNNPKMYESNSNSSYNLNQSGMNNPMSKETSYLEQFPPPPFGSPLKQNNRGRGNSFGNIRGRQQISRNNLNFNQGRSLPFHRAPFGNKNSNDRRQFNSNEYSNESTPFSNVKQNNMINKRGNRGMFNINKGRNMENQGYQQRNSADSWYQQNELNDSLNDSSYSQHEYEDAEFFHNKDQNLDFEDERSWNSEKAQSNQDYEQNYSQHNIEGSNQKREGEISKFTRNLESLSNLKPGFDNQDVSRMNLSGTQRNGGYYQNRNFRQTEANHRPFQRQQFPRAHNIPVNKPPIKLMDVVVQLSSQSPVIKRRQNLIDQWQRDVKEVHNRRITINYFWPIIKSALSAEIQDLLLVHYYSQNDCVNCEIILDDIFLIQGKGDDQELAIEAASKSLFEMFKNRVYVITSTRDADGEVVPGFCISSNQNGPINLPPICRNSDKLNDAQFLLESKVDNFSKLATSQSPDQGIFLVLESSTNERDQSINSLVATARFNNSVIDYQHEKLPHAPHISSCVITIDGVEIERHEARDYLVAKRQAADKVIAKLKQSRPQITLRLDKAKVIKKEDLKKDESFEKAVTEYLQTFYNSNEDIPLKFDCDFSTEEKNILTTITSTLNLSYKSEGKNSLFIFKQFSIVEMKKRLLSQGFCAQYQLIEKGSDLNSQ